MKKSNVNKKMKILQEFYNIDDAYISKLLENKNINEDYDYSKLSIQNLIKLTKDLGLSLDVLEYIFCNDDSNISELKKLLFLYRSEGIPRRYDELGRLVIPNEYRMFFHIKEKDLTFISLDFNGNFIIKTAKRCICCGNQNKLVNRNDIFICERCIKTLNKKV